MREKCSLQERKTATAWICDAYGCSNCIKKILMEVVEEGKAWGPNSRGDKRPCVAVHGTQKGLPITTEVRF